MAIVGEAVVVVRGKDEFSSNIKKSTAAAAKTIDSNFASTMQSVGTKMQTVGTRVSDIGDKMSMRITTPVLAGAGAMAFFGIKSAAAMEQAKIGFTTMLGSADKADKMLRDLQDFAAHTPFEFSGLVKSSQQLLAMGFQAKDIIPTMTAVGDSVAAMGGSEENVAAVTRALGQMQAKGKASSEEMLQLTEQGIPAWDMLAQKMGVSVPKAMDAVRKGQVDATTAINAVVDGSEKKFGGMMEKQSKTFTGQMSNFKDTIEQQLGAAFAQVLPQLTQVIKELTPVTGEFIKQLAPAIKTTANALIPLIKGLAGLLKIFNSLPGPMQNFILLLGGIVVAAGPVMSVGGRVVTAVGGMTKAFGAASSGASAFAKPGGGLDGIRLRMMAVTDGMKSFGSKVAEATKSAGSSLSSFATATGGKLKTLGSSIATMAKSAGSALVGMAKTIGLAIKSLTVSLMTNPVVLIVVAVVALVAALVILYKKWEPFRNMVNAVGRAVADTFVKAWDKAKAAFEVFVDAFQKTWTFLVGIVKRYGLLILAALLPMIGIPILIMKNWDKIVDFFSKIFSAAVKVVSRGIDIIVDWFKGLPGKMASGLGNLWAAIKDKFTDFFRMARTALVSFVVNYVNFWRQLPGRLFNALGNLWGRINSKFQDLFRSMRQFVVGRLADIVDFFRKLPSRLSGALSGLWSAMAGKFNDLFGAIRGKIADGVNAAADVMNNLPGRLAGALGGVAGQVTGALSRGLSGIKSTVLRAVSGAGEWLKSAGSQIIGGLISGITSRIGELSSKVKSLGSMIKNVKGPPSYDAVMLEPAGRLIMGGLIGGIERGIPGLKSSLRGVTDVIAGTRATVDAGLTSRSGLAAGGPGKVINLFPNATVIMGGPGDGDAIVKRMESLVAGSRL